MNGVTDNSQEGSNNGERKFYGKDGKDSYYYNNIVNYTYNAAYGMAEFEPDGYI